ncbi:hypothetical protein [Paenibacillus lutimineralis]|uniref:hypothetical protein n=1 Tax=Paenibacillus lutimineralis TaxID=2707005 RepID=UPI0013A68405|nr:hypothetical protein [Paenibacillus lutimineralis]
MLSAEKAKLKKCFSVSSLKVNSMLPIGFLSPSVSFSRSGASGSCAAGTSSGGV